MEIDKILSATIQQFIIENTNTSISKLALGKNPFPEIDFKIILNQIESRVKSVDKLPTWYNSKNIVYPSKISIEQTSSENTAKYKSEIVAGNSLIDLTGGFGVDDYYFAKKVKKVIHCEINEALSSIVAHNFSVLGINVIKCICGDSEAILTELNQQFDWIYIDPSRRNDTKGKVFLLKDCLPNVPDLQVFYFKYSNSILIKTAPILDISAGLNELKNVKKIHIVAVENEVKELLWEIEKDYFDAITIEAVNLSKNKKEVFSFVYNSQSDAKIDLPQNFLYEPNSAIMKSGGFNEIGNQFAVSKLHLHSHLYTSNELIDFPGRIFKIDAVINYSKPEMKVHLENSKANITIRNFGETVENIRKKWKIKEGGNQYCFFTTDMNDKKIVLICTKINT